MCGILPAFRANYGKCESYPPNALPLSYRGTGKLDPWFTTRCTSVPLYEKAWVGAQGIRLRSHIHPDQRDVARFVRSFGAKRMPCSSHQDRRRPGKRSTQIVEGCFLTLSCPVFRSLKADFIREAGLTAS